MKKLFRRILLFFGLMPVSRAKVIFIELTAVRERIIMKYAHEDFGVLPKVNYEKDIRAWAETAFDQVIAENRDDIWCVYEGEPWINHYAPNL